MQLTIKLTREEIEELIERVREAKISAERVEIMLNKIDKLYARLKPNAESIARFVDNAIDIIVKYEDAIDEFRCHGNDAGGIECDTLADMEWLSVEELKTGLRKLQEHELKDIVKFIGKELEERRKELANVKYNLTMINGELYRMKGDNMTELTVDNLMLEIGAIVYSVADVLAHVNCLARGCRCGGLDFEGPAIICKDDDDRYCHNYVSLTNTECCEESGIC